MTNPITIRTIKHQLFSGQSAGKVFAILDGASVPNLLAVLMTHAPKHVCLYRGELAPDMAEVAPYLVMLEGDAQFTDWLIGNGWGKHWGIFGAGDVDLSTLRRHFRTFLIVYDPAGKSLYFRFYDPRVLRIYLPTCNEGELRAVYGPVSYFLFEDEDPHFAHLCVVRANNPILETSLLSLVNR